MGTIMFVLAAIITVVWFLSNKMTNLFIKAFEENPARSAEKAQPIGADVLYPTRQWRPEPRRA